MGTRSITRIYDTDGTQLVEIYRQRDGYFEGHGKELGYSKYERFQGTAEEWASCAFMAEGSDNDG